ncbi:agarase [Rufibacter roseus]|uniref:Agarase n=1 Tax=Rufibacter roseus TaxID=1567108 RepID=A0ABW2DU24_9BACT|nr:agarase [Rufibacter roseus]
MKKQMLRLFFLSAMVSPWACKAQQKSPEPLIVQAKRGLTTSDATLGYGEWKDYETRSLAHLTDFKPKNSVKLSKYGGRKDKRTQATGFFHVKQLDGRWWAIDPEGYYFLHTAVNTVSMGGSTRNKEALKEKFTDTKGWAQGTHQMLLDHGYNGLGSWSTVKEFRETPLQEKSPLAYTINLDFMSAYGKKRGGTYQKPGHRGYPNDCIFVFDPDFETFSDEHVKQLVAYKDDKNLFGYFSDNEMPLLRRNLEGYLKLDPKEPGYQAAKKWIDEKGISPEQITEAHKKEFLQLVTERYFSIVSKAIRKYDPNHMYLGCRYYGPQRDYPEMMEAAGKYVDIVSINYYNVWTPEAKKMEEWGKLANKPFMITEWYVKGEDSGLPNKTGAGWMVKTQEDRGLFYQNFTLSLLESKNCVGWHWFQYQDNDPTKEGAEPSNIDANKGIVDNYYNVYAPLAEKMKEINRNKYQLADYFIKKKN